MIHVLLAAFEIIIISICISSMFNQKLIQLKKIWMFGLFLLAKGLFIYITSTFTSAFIAFVFDFVGLITFTKFYFSVPIKSSINSNILAYIIIILVQFPFVILNAIVLHISDLILLSLAGNIFSLIVAFALTKLVPLNRFYHFIFNKKHIGTLLTTNIFAFVVIIAMYFKMDNTRFIDVIIFFFVSLLILLSMNIIVLNQVQFIQKQKQQLLAYDEYMPTIKSLIDSVRAKQHHHTNEKQALIGLMYTHKDYEKLTSSMKEFLDSSEYVEPPEYLLKLNLLLISGFLYAKEQEAKSVSKKLEIHILNYDLISDVPEYILVEIFGILIDNALDATKENGTVYVYIDSKDNKIIIKTINEGYTLVPDDRTKLFAPGYTTKEHGSGIGLPTLHSIVINQFNGEIIIGNENETDIVFEIIV